MVKKQMGKEIFTKYMAPIEQLMNKHGLDFEVFYFSYNFSSVYCSEIRKNKILKLL